MMNTAPDSIARISRTNVLYFLFLLVAGGMLWYPFQASAASLSCKATPFSQTINAGEPVTYTISVTSDVPVSAVKLALGNFPTGVTGSLSGSGFIVTPGDLTLTIQTARTARIASFSLTILEDVAGQTPSNVVCQYALRVLAPPTVPPSAIEEGLSTGDEIIETADSQEPGTETSSAETEDASEPQEVSAPAPSPEAQAPVLKKREEFSYDSRGLQVAGVQALLARDPTLYPEGLVTGWYGPLTRSAVRRFQERAGITPTGEVDQATQEKLDDIRKTQAPSFRFLSYLIREVRGDIVVILQNTLKELGFFPKLSLQPVTLAPSQRHR